MKKCTGHPDKPYYCAICKIGFTEQRSRDRHNKDFHSNPMQDGYVGMRNRQQSFEHLKQYNLNRNKFVDQNESTGPNVSDIHNTPAMSHMGLQSQEQFH